MNFKLTECKPDNSFNTDYQQGLIFTDTDSGRLSIMFCFKVTADPWIQSTLLLRNVHSVSQGN